jgi:hypothetical protein|tara:strand:+ start:1036 stop:1155 length:120 start_codon:yes stop_codon:yes gene_type:complete
MINNTFIFDDGLIVVELVMKIDNSINEENFNNPIEMMFF